MTAWSCGVVIDLDSDLGSVAAISFEVSELEEVLGVGLAVCSFVGGVERGRKSLGILIGYESLVNTTLFEGLRHEIINRTSWALNLLEVSFL